MNISKTVFITGGTSDIGRAIATRFAKEGWNTLCHYHSDDEKAKEFKLLIESLGVCCYLFKADLSEKKEIDDLSHNLKNFQIDSVINNAGTCFVSKHFTELTIDDISKTFMVNVFAPMILTSLIFPSMKERQFGRIVNISSIAAKYGGSAFSMHYGSSKRALEGVTKTFAKEGAEYNVLVNTIRPGVIDTGFHEKFPKDMEKRTSMIPLKRMGIPDDIAAMACFLGSDMNKFITNEIIAIAGGE